MPVRSTVDDTTTGGGGVEVEGTVVDDGGGPGGKKVDVKIFLDGKKLLWNGNPTPSAGVHHKVKNMICVWWRDVELKKKNQGYVFKVKAKWKPGLYGRARMICVVSSSNKTDKQIDYDVGYIQRYKLKKAKKPLGSKAAKKIARKVTKKTAKKAGKKTRR